MKRTKEYRKSYYRKYYQNNKEKYKLYGITYRKKYPDAYRNWVRNNPEKARAIQRRSQRKILKRVRATPRGSLNNRIGGAIWRSLKQNKAGRKWELLVGYTVDDLKTHLERLFTPDMNWEKFLKGKIHIDHIKPKSLFNYTKAEDPEFKECWALSNLQPLEAKKNIKKSNKY